MILSYHSAALAEAADAASWYALERDVLLAEEFAAELEATLHFVVRHPGIGTPGARRTRAFRLARFPYTAVYRVQGESIRVLAIAHQSRRPRFWTGRR